MSAHERLELIAEKYSAFTRPIGWQSSAAGPYESFWRDAARDLQWALDVTRAEDWALLAILPDEERA